MAAIICALRMTVQDSTARRASTRTLQEVCLFALQQEQDHEVEELYASLNTPRPVLVVLSGPSGVGKDSVILGLKESGYPFYFVVTATTRPKRHNEVDGIDYHFVSVGDFAEMIENNELLEYAVVYGDYKGIPKKHVREALASGQDVIMRIDVQGAATIRALVPNAVTIFLTAESEEELVRRLPLRVVLHQSQPLAEVGFERLHAVDPDAPAGGLARHQNL